MPTKTQLQEEIAKYNAQIETLKSQNAELAQSRDSYASMADQWITSFNKDYNFGGKHDCWGADPLGGASSYINAGQTVADNYCTTGSGCSKQGCRDRIKTINDNLQVAIDRNRSITTNNTEIEKLLKLITGLNSQILALPESQAQIQSAVASAAAEADAKKKKWMIFGIIVLVIVIGSIIIYIRVRK